MDARHRQSRNAPQIGLHQNLWRVCACLKQVRNHAYHTISVVSGSMAFALDSCF
ncbi:hypothetical protein ACFOEM_09905 [Paenalcaligenes hominis]|uniref:hypothetical protein n=1 Tax=Paenalcaligenes hominis TaxID=643674 RepID=UPI00360C08D0